MIIKIQPPSDMMEATINYNEKKADGPEGIRDNNYPMSQEEYGHVVVTRNVPEDSTLEEEFERLRLLNSKKTRGRNLEKAAFHMSVNPGIADTPLTESSLVSLVDEIMKELGYGSCPYRIYKHTDIEREHYHIVSCRIGQDGKKIKDSFENKRVNKLAEQLAEKYGFIVGLEENSVEEDIEEVNHTNISEEAPEGHQQESEFTKPAKTKKKFVPPFDVESSLPVNEQFKQIHEEAMKWSFTTPEQYKALLKWRFKVEVEEFEDGIHYIGLNKTGKEVTPPVSERELFLDISNDIISKCTSVNMKKRRTQKQRIEKIAEETIKECHSLKEFRKMMHTKGIYVVISYTESGQPFGVTWLDRATRCAMKGSETSCDLAWLKNKAEMDGWNLERAHRFDKTSAIKNNYKSRYRIAGEIQKRIQEKKNEALTRQILRDQDERASGNAINKSELNDDPNNIKV